MKKLVFAELIGGVSFQMMEDRKVVIVSDTAFFLVTTTEHCTTYPELKFDPVPQTAIQQYELESFISRMNGQ